MAPKPPPPSHYGALTAAQQAALNRLVARLTAALPEHAFTEEQARARA